MEKGEYGYIDHYKKNKLKTAAVFIALIAVILAVVLCVYRTNQTYFIVIPIILALPFAKYMVAYIVVYPFHSMSGKQYDAVTAFLEGRKHIYPVYDVTLASESAFSFLSFLLIYDGAVYACMGEGNRKFNQKDIQVYLEALVKKAGYQCAVLVFETMEDTLDAIEERLHSDGAEHEVSDKRSESIKKAILTVGV